MINRRLFLLGTAALGGCAAGSGPTFAVAANDVTIIAKALSGVASQLGGLGIPGLTPDVVAKLSAYASAVAKGASALSSTSDPGAARSTVSDVEGYVNAFLGVASGFPLPAPIPTVLQAAAILLPVIEAAVGLIMTSAPALGKARASAPTMTADQARVILKSSR